MLPSRKMSPVAYNKSLSVAYVSGSPTLIQPFNPTPYALLPIRGSATGARNVTARGGAGNTGLFPVESDGTFCLEVRLIEDALNNLEIIPLDQKGCPGESAKLAMTHRTQAGDGGVGSVRNVSKDGPVSASVQPTQGALSAINDGNSQTASMLSFTDVDGGDTCDSFAWIKLDLGKVYTVSRVELRWAASHAKCWSLLVSSVAAPADPDPQSGDWTLVKDEQNGDSTAQNIAITPERARWVALLLYEDAKSDGNTTETFGVAELSVFGQDPNATPGPSPDTCN